MLTSIKTKDKIYKSYVNARNTRSFISAESKYKQYRNILNKLLRIAKSSYLNEKFENCKNDIKLTWKNINHLLISCNTDSNIPKIFHFNNGPLNTPPDIADAFNEYYTNIGPSLAQSMTSSPTDHKHYLTHPRGSHSFFMLPTCEQEVLSIIHNMKPKTSSGYDSLTPKLIRETASGILTPLTHIVNISLKNGKVPLHMKLAKVIPIFKSGVKTDVVNYRPISILPVFSKVLEKIVFLRLYKYLSQHNILSVSQYGFRACLSTDLAILEFQDPIANILSAGSWCLGIFLDLSKAFDTINHNILLS